MVDDIHREGLEKNTLCHTILNSTEDVSCGEVPSPLFKERISSNIKIKYYVKYLFVCLGVTISCNK